MGFAVDGIEPCAKSELEDIQCTCGIELETLAGKKVFDGVIHGARCRLCLGVSDHYRYRMERFGMPWGVVICNVCMLVCDEY